MEVSWLLLAVMAAQSAVQTASQNSANPSPTDPIYVSVKYEQKQALLPCPIREQKPLVLKWKKEESLIAIGEGEFKHLSVSTDEHGATLIIATPGVKDLGNYTCVLYNPGNYSAVEGMIKHFVVMSELRIEIEGKSLVVEGEALQLRCKVTSKTPPHRIAWQFGNNTYDESRNRVEFLSDNLDIPNAIFKIDVSVLEDHGTYTCLAYATAASNATAADILVWVIGYNIVLGLKLVAGVVLAALFIGAAFFWIRKKRDSETTVFNKNFDTNSTGHHEEIEEGQFPYIAPTPPVPDRPTNKRDRHLSVPRESAPPIPEEPDYIIPDAPDNLDRDGYLQPFSRSKVGFSRK